MLENEIWMNQASIAMHIKNIYQDGKLVEDSTCKEFLQIQTEGTRQMK